jgi:hypothetical protein
VFQIGSTLTTASASSVVVINGGSVCNAFWQVGSSATLGTATSFAGNILALASITVTTGASLRGRALARTGAVTLDTNTVGSCAVGAVVCSAITLAPATLPNGTKSVAYSQTLTASGGTAPISFSITAGVLPTGLTLTAAGVIAGTPTAAGSFTFTVRATDINACPGSATYTIVIAAPACPVITLAPPTLPNGTLAVAYSQTITGSGGTAPYTFGVTVGTLPTGLALTAAGVLSGTPTTAASTSLTIQGTDANSCVASVPYTIKIAAAGCPVITLAPPTLPAGAVGATYSQSISGSGGTAPYSFSVFSGALPTGLTLTSAGLLSGTPTTVGTSSPTIRGTDANACVGDLPYTVLISASVPTLPQAFLLLLALGLAGIGYQHLRRRARAT